MTDRRMDRQTDSRQTFDSIASHRADKNNTTDLIRDSILTQMADSLAYQWFIICELAVGMTDQASSISCH